MPPPSMTVVSLSAPSIVMSPSRSRSPDEASSDSGVGGSIDSIYFPGGIIIRAGTPRRLACITAARRVQFPEPSSQIPSSTASVASAVESTTKVPTGVEVSSVVGEAGVVSAPELPEAFVRSGVAVEETDPDPDDAGLFEDSVVSGSPVGAVGVSHATSSSINMINTKTKVTALCITRLRTSHP